MISDGMNYAYFFFQLQNVAELIPAFLQNSAKDVPSPAWLTINAFYASVKFDA